jgi:hypothetical protein
MAEIKEFVVNDRRKFTAEGDIRPDAPPSEPKAPRPETLQPKAPPPDAFDSSARLTETPAQSNAGPLEMVAPDAGSDQNPDELPAAPTAEQSQQAAAAFDATVDRIDTAIRATNPGMDRIPPMDFTRVVQSIYMQAILQLGGVTAEGQQPRVDILGARQTIDMLTVLAEKTRGNLTDNEAKLIDSALFELRMGFLEVTQALARQAQTAAQTTTGAPTPPLGPSIVR